MEQKCAITPILYTTYVPLKKKMHRANHAPYVSKALRKAIMKRSCLEEVYFKKQDNHS